MADGRIVLWESHGPVETSKPLLSVGKLIEYGHGSQ